VDKKSAFTQVFAVELASFFKQPAANHITKMKGSLGMKIRISMG
jgi:hypothetical protein